jgi:hypothetical protein
MFLDVHHIEPEADGGPDVIENAAPVCNNCHRLYGHDSAKRKELRAIRDWWWERCARIDDAQMSRAGERLDQMFQAYQKSHAREQARLLEEMKTFIATELREQAAKVSSVDTITDLIQASTRSSSYGEGPYGAGPYGGVVTKCTTCGAEKRSITAMCPRCGAP